MTQRKNVKRNKGLADAVQAAKPMYASLHSYKPDLETSLGEQKHCGLERLLGKLNGLSYEDIKKHFPNLVVPIDEFVKTRNLKPMQSSPGT